MSAVVMVPLPHQPGAEGVILDPTRGVADRHRSIGVAEGDHAIAAAWADFETYLLTGLDDAWITRRRWRDEDQVAASRLHVLSLVLDDCGRVHVFVAERPGLDPRDAALAARTLSVAASRIFERLARRWPLQVRRGPFETAPWRGVPDIDDAA